MNFSEKSKYFLPQFLIDIYRLVKAYQLKKIPNRILKKNSKWLNQFRGENVIIVGNGPSLKKIDINLLKGKKVIVMNSFEHATWKNDVEIVAHCIGEPSMVSAWSKNEIINNINGTNSLSYWLHYTSYGHFEESTKKDKLHYTFITKEARLYGLKQINLAGPTLAYQTTAQMAIMVALYMGFKEISLIGFDHDWLASPDYSRHFYSDKRDSHDTLNEMSYLEIVCMIERMWNIYYKLNEIAIHKGVNIFNLTEDSYLDVFEKKQFEKVINGV
jgi:hypothetical protein